MDSQLVAGDAGMSEELVLHPCYMFSSYQLFFEKESQMSRHDIRPCPCGSGLDSQWEYDACGIELDRMCDACRPEKLKKYRPEILTGYSQEDMDEQIEPD